MDAYTLARRTALFNLYKQHKHGGIVTVGRGQVHLIVTMTSPHTIQVTARHYNEIGRYVSLQWLNILVTNGNEKIIDYKEVEKDGKNIYTGE